MMGEKVETTKLLTPKTIAEELGGAKQEGDGYLAFCPAHNDTKTPSLLISKGEKASNGLMVKCRAGCKTPMVIKELKDRELWPAKKRKKLKEKEAEYNYYNADGSYAFTKARFRKADGDKTFEIGRKDDKAPNGWKKGQPKGQKRVLYKLPELIDCSPDRVVFVVEGEKDVDNLTALGCQAVCNHDGAGGWSEAYNEWLEGLHVVVLPDNDRAGRDHAADVVRVLDGVAASVKVLELPGLEEKGDVSDWIEAGGDREELGRLVIEVAGELEERWEDKLLMTGGEHPKVKNLEQNYRLYLHNHEQFKGRLQYDEFANNVLLDGKSLGDEDVSNIVCDLQNLDLQATRDKVLSAIKLVAHECSFDPLRGYVKRLEWDGMPRLATMFREYMGATAQSDEYLEIVAIRWMTSGIARAMKPGCKADQWLILEGGQGAGKSAGVEALSPFEEWFQDQLPDIGKNPKDAKMALFGNWIVEIAELEAIRKADQEAVKKFASLRVDKERLPYERSYKSFPRRCVFIGTHNPGIDNGYLTDSTGARRFLPVEVGEINLDGIKRDRDQLWAEAKTLYEAGERWWTEASDPGVLDEQRARFIQSDYAEEAFQYLEFTPFLETDGSGMVTWTERDEPLTVFIPKYFWQDRFNEQWVKAPWKAKKEINGAFQNAGWEKVHMRFPELAEDHGDATRIKLSGWVNYFGSTCLESDDDGGDDDGPGGGMKTESVEKAENGGVDPQVEPQVDPQVDPVETGYGINKLGGIGSTGSTTSIGKDYINNIDVKEGDIGRIKRKGKCLETQVDPLEGDPFPPMLGGEGENPLRLSSYGDNEEIGDCKSLNSNMLFERAAGLGNLDDLKGLIEGADGPIGFDVETTGLRVTEGAKCRLAQFWRGGVGVVIDLFEFEDGLGALKEVLDGSHLVAFNAQFELMWLRDAGIEVRMLDDAKLAYAALFGGTTSLERACKQFLDVELNKDWQVSNWGGELCAEQIKYAVDDAEYCLRLWQKFAPVMVEQEVLGGYHLLRRAMLPVAMMQEAGMKFDLESHGVLVERLKRGFELADTWLKKKVPEVGNWNSPVQVKAWLEPQLNRRGRFKWEKTRTGKISTSEGAIREAFADGVVPAGAERVLAGYLVRQRASTVLKTFGKSLAGKVMDDGRIYGDLQISGAVTGRMSSSKPNLQNMPNGNGFRELFVADSGKKIVVCDYSQIEVRVGGLLADEPVLERAFAEGKDIHTSSAALMYGVGYDEVTKSQRKNAKTLTFGMQYGMGVKSLAKTLGMTESEAIREIAKWEATYPRVAEWREISAEEGKEYLELFTAGGRRIELNRNPSPSVCYNYPVQGSAGDVMYAALRVLAEELEMESRDWKMLNVVHDEVIMEVPAADVEEAAKLLEDCMMVGYLQIFPEADLTGVVDATWGDNWAAK